MDIKSVIEFIKRETPQNVKKIHQIFDDCKELLQTEQDYLKELMHDYIIKEEYSKIANYIAIAEEFSEIQTKIGRFEEECDLERREIVTSQLPQQQKVDDDEDEDEELSQDKRINYEEYRVDESVEYDLLTDFRHMKPAAFSLDGKRYPARLWKLVLIKTCELLYQKNSEIFNQFTEDKFMQGKSRIYFAKDNSGMAKPEGIMGTDICVETNLSANSIRDLIIKMLDQYRIPHAAYKIFLSKDLNPLHLESDINVGGEVNMCETVEQKDESECHSNLDMSELCIDYDEKTGKCLNKDSPYFVMECCGKKNCEYQQQTDKTQNHSNKIFVLSKKELKKMQCIKCSSDIERTTFWIEYETKQGLKKQLVCGCWCNLCKSAYITEGTYQAFFKDKLVKNIEIEFIESLG